MPELDSSIVSWLTGVLAAVTQLVKGLVLTEEAKRWLPLGVVFLAALVGFGLAMAYGRDPIAGLMEGVVGGLSSLGLYAVGKSAAPGVVNTDGWIRRE